MIDKGDRPGHALTRTRTGFAILCLSHIPSLRRQVLLTERDESRVLDGPQHKFVSLIAEFFSRPGSSVETAGLPASPIWQNCTRVTVGKAVR